MADKYGKRIGPLDDIPTTSEASTITMVVTMHTDDGDFTPVVDLLNMISTETGGNYSPSEVADAARMYAIEAFFDYELDREFRMQDSTDEELLQAVGEVLRLAGNLFSTMA